MNFFARYETSNKTLFTKFEGKISDSSLIKKKIILRNVVISVENIWHLGYKSILHNCKQFIYVYLCMLIPNCYNAFAFKTFIMTKTLITIKKL